VSDPSLAHLVASLPPGSAVSVVASPADRDALLLHDVVEIIPASSWASTIPSSSSTRWSWAGRAADRAASRLPAVRICQAVDGDLVETAAHRPIVAADRA
jgi:hypothetical protein